MTGPSSVFAALHVASGPFLLPNAWDVASALLLADAGFPAVGTTSLGVTAAAGLPDGAGAGRDLNIALAAALIPSLSVPLTVDLEGGYSDDPAEVADLAAQLADLGVAGINLEDGRPGGQLRPTAEHAAVIRAVTDATPSLFVNARTDTYWLTVGADQERLPETVRRLAPTATQAPPACSPQDFSTRRRSRPCRPPWRCHSTCSGSPGSAWRTSALPVSSASALAQRSTVTHWPLPLTQRRQPAPTPHRRPGHRLPAAATTPTRTLTRRPIEHRLSVGAGMRSLRRCHPTRGSRGGTTPMSSDAACGSDRSMPQLG